MIKILFLPFYLIFVVISDANAYIDLGSLTVVVQAIIGGFAMIATTITIYWKKIKDFFNKQKNQDKKTKL